MRDTDTGSRPHRRALDMTRDIPRTKDFRARHALPDPGEFETRRFDPGQATVRAAVPPPAPPVLKVSSWRKLAMLWANLKAGRFRNG